MQNDVFRLRGIFQAAGDEIDHEDEGEDGHEAEDEDEDGDAEKDDDGDEDEENDWDTNEDEYGNEDGNENDDEVGNEYEVAGEDIEKYEDAGDANVMLANLTFPPGEPWLTISLRHLVLFSDEKFGNHILQRGFLQSCRGSAGPNEQANIETKLRYIYLFIFVLRIFSECDEKVGQKMSDIRHIFGVVITIDSRNWRPEIKRQPRFPPSNT